MHFSQFAAYLNKTTLPKSVRDEVRREALRRFAERLSAGRADGELTFNDLFDRCEASLTA